MIYGQSSANQEIVSSTEIPSLEQQAKPQLPSFQVISAESQLPPVCTVNSLQQQNEIARPNILVEETQPIFKYETKGRKLSPKSHLLIASPYGISLPKQPFTKTVPVPEIVVVNEPPLNLIVNVRL